MFRLAMSVVLCLATSAALAAPATIDGARIDFETFADGLRSPVVLTSPPGDERIFVVEKTGSILIFKAGARVETPFLDTEALVSSGGEQGLLGLAFHPDFANNGRFFVNYTDRQGDTQIVEYRAESDVADAQSARVLLSIDQPFGNHNGGWIGFGPDGLLYIGMGDGGSGGDPQGNGQNPDALLGKILRIDVDAAEPYGIPPGNPFANGGGAPEVFLLGVRNPWRNAFDGEMLYIADVGQSATEEITVVSVAAAAGENLGWNVIEGADCYPAGAVCVQGGFVMPVHTYSHDEGCSITGGYVYRGQAIPELAGRYFFADYCVGTLRSLRYANGIVTGVTDSADDLGPLGMVLSFGQDNAGELYVLTDAGVVLKMVRAD